MLPQRDRNENVTAKACDMTLLRAGFAQPAAPLLACARIVSLGLLCLLLMVWTLPRFGVIEHAHPSYGPHIHTYHDVLQLLEQSEKHSYHNASHPHPHPHAREVYVADARTTTMRHGHVYDDSLLTLCPIHPPLLLFSGRVLRVFQTALAPPEQAILTFHARAPPALHFSSAVV